MLKPSTIWGLDFGVQAAAPQLRADIALPDELGEGEESEELISDEDMEFVRKHSRSLGFLKDLDKEALDRCGPIAAGCQPCLIDGTRSVVHCDAQTDSLQRGGRRDC